MKSIFIILLAVAATCSCSKVEKVAPDTKASWNSSVWVYDVGAQVVHDPLHPAQDIPFTLPPALRAEDVTDVPAKLVADPFIFKHGDQWLLFIEVWNMLTGQGDLAYATSSNGLGWTYGGIMLDEPFHLSYPFVFEHEGAFYMIPESHHAGGIRLYKASDFPRKWEFQKEIIHGDFVDNSLLRFNDHWWIFCSEGVENLHLFHADSLEGPWMEHPASPMIVHNAHRARCGGRPLVYKGKPYRIAQDCSPWYGIGSRMFEITRLTTNAYEERETAFSPILTTNTVAWAPKGMHQYDVQPLDASGTNWLAVFDGARKVQPLDRIHVEWDDHLSLKGYSIYRTTRKPGQSLLTRFYWKNMPSLTNGPLPSFYVHFRNKGKIVFQADFQLHGDQYVYEAPVTIPSNAPPGDYTIHCGLHDPEKGHKHTILKSSVPVNRDGFDLPMTLTVTE